MKVSEVADLADTTVRTVRHYHQIGLLEVPHSVGGIRDYGLDHLARLLRIRWLVSSGMSLPSISEVLPAAGPPDADAVVGELREVLADIDEHLTILQAKRERVAALIARAERGQDISPLPAQVSEMYRRLLARISDPAARRAVESERAMAIVLAVRGLLPPAVVDLVDSFDDEDMDDIVAMFVAFGGLVGHTDDEAVARRSAVVEPATRLIARHRELFAAVVEGIDTDDDPTATNLLARLATAGFPELGPEDFAVWFGPFRDATPASDGGAR